MADLTTSTDIDTFMGSADQAAMRTNLTLNNVTNHAQTQAAVVPNTAPTAGQLLVGNAGGTAYAPVSLSSDATVASTGALTLATVNSNVGSYGSATQSAAVTVNAKGLVTAVSTSTITPAVGSITGLGTGVATALAVNVGSAGAPVVNGGALGTPSSGALTNCTFPTLNQDTTGYASALKSATTTVSVSAATAPTSGQVLTATSGTAATWQTPTGGGGSSPQPVQSVLTTTATTTSTTYADITGLTASYTPTSVSQKVLVRGSISFGSTSSNQAAFRLARDGTALTQATASGSRTVSHAAFLDLANGLGMESTSFEFLDTPGTTSAVTYSIQWKRGGSSGTCYLNRAQDDLDYDSRANTVSTLTVIPFAV